MSDLKKASTETINGLARYCDHCGMSVDEYTQIQITNEAKKHATDPRSPMYLKAVDKHGNDISQEVIEYILNQEYELEDLRDKLETVRRMLEQEYFDPKSFDSTMTIKDYEHVTCGEEYADVVLKRLREALK